MTDRIHSLTVVLKKDIRDDDAESIITALSMVKGVLSATPHVANIETHMAYARARWELQSKLYDVLKDDS